MKVKKRDLGTTKLLAFWGKNIPDLQRNERGDFTWEGVT